MIKETIRIDTDQIVEIEEYNLVVEFNKDRIIEVDQGNEQSYRNDCRRGNFRGNVRVYQNHNFRRQNNMDGYRGNYRNDNHERGRSRSRERSYPSNFRRNDRSNSNSKLGQDQEQILIETKLGVISVQKMIILQKIVHQPKKKEREISNRANVQFR